MDTDEVLRALHAGSQLGDRQGGGVGAQHAILRHGCLDLRPNLVLQLGVLEHGLDHDVTVGQVGVIDGRLDAVQQCLGLLLGGLATLQRLGLQTLGVGLALLGSLHLDVLQHDLHASLRCHVGDRCTHHAGTNHAQLLELLLLNVLRAGAATVAVLQVEEECLHHVLGGRAGDQLHEVAGLHGQGLFDVLQLCALNGGLQDGLRSRHRCALDLLGHISREGRQELCQLRVGRGSARDLEALLIPRLGCFRVLLDPLLGSVDQLVCRDDLVDQAGLQCVFCAELAAGGQDLHQCVLDAQHADHAGHTAATRQQTQGDLWQANLQALGVRSNAVVRGQSDLQATAERRTVDGSDDRHAEGLDCAQTGLHAVDLLRDCFCVFRGGLDHRFDVAAGEEGLLRGGDDHALGLAGFHCALQLLHQLRQLALEGVVHGVDRLVRVVHGDGYDAVAILVPLEHAHV